MVDLTTAAILGGSSLLSGLFGSSGASEQADAAQAGIDLQAEQWEDYLAMMQPYVDAGALSLDSIEAMLLGTSGSTPQVESGYATTTTNNGGNAVDFGTWQRTIASEDGGGYADYVAGLDAQTSTTDTPYWAFNGTQYGTEAEALAAQDAWVAANPDAAAGTAASWGSQEGFEDFRNSDYYNLLEQEGWNALQQGLAQSGNSYSGAALKAAQQYGQDLASSQYGDYLAMEQAELDNLYALAGLGSNASNSLGNLGSSYANSTSALLADQGAAEASSSYNWANSINSGLQNYLYFDALGGLT